MIKVEKIILTIFIFSLSFVPFLWMTNGQLILGYDAVFPLNPTAFLLDRIYSWTTTQGFDMDQSGIQGSLIIHLIDSLPQLIGFSHQASQKIVFSFWFFLLLLSPYILITKLERAGIVKSRYLRYFFPVLYTFNFYVLQGWWVAERTKFSLLVATPLILSIILPMIVEDLSARKVLRYALLCSLVLTFFNGGGWVGLPLYGGLIVVLSVVAIFLLFFYIFRKMKRNIIYLILFFVLFPVSYVFLNAYTFLPFISTTIKDYSVIVQESGGVSGIVAWTRFLSADTSLINLLRLQGIPDWYNNRQYHPYSPHYLNNPFLVAASFLFPLFIFLALLSKKRENKIIIFLFLSLLIVTLIFAAGTHKPTGALFEMLMNFVPGFVVFRSAIFKFGYAYWIAASFLIGIFLSTFTESLIAKIKVYKLKFFIGLIFPLFIIISIVLYHYPYLTGNIFTIDPTGVSSRVVIPSYVFDFSKWWAENGKTDRALLLPRMHDNWRFEQYKWGYMSLFPLLGNFANINLVENASVVLPEERNLLDKLYLSINDSDYTKMDALVNVLGIRYLLVRGDFYHDLPDQEVEDPSLLKVKIANNPKIVGVKSFGPWNLYMYQEQKPLIFAKADVTLALGRGMGEQYLLSDNPLTFDKEVFLENRETFSYHIAQPECLNCNIEREDLDIEIPKLRILLDSKFYELVEMRDKLFKSKQQSIEDRVANLLGRTLRMTSQINELLAQGRDEQFVMLATDKQIGILAEIAYELPNVMNKSANPYHVLFTIQQYLAAQDRYISNIVSTRVDKKNLFTSLSRLLLEINKLNDQVKELSGYRDLSVEKKYRLLVAKEGFYEVKIDKNSIGTLIDDDISKINLLIDDKIASVSSILEGDYINFGNIFIDDKEHILTLNFPEQINLLTSGNLQDIAGRKCMTSVFSNFSPNKNYRLRYRSKNNFDPNFFLFIDNGETYAPFYKAFFPISREYVTDNRIVISSIKMNLKKTSNKIRTAFCAPTLTEDLFKENITELSLIELTNPTITFLRKEEKYFPKPPKVKFTEIDQAHYKVFVENPESPYYLVFNKRYSLGWKASIGDHYMSNRFSNAWLIDQKGNLDIDIVYEPQQYVNKGIVISIVSVIIALFILRYKRHEKKN